MTISRIRLERKNCFYRMGLTENWELATGNCTYRLNNSRSLRVCARLTGISVCFLSSMRNW
jgi:hypothetical protein